MSGVFAMALILGLCVSSSHAQVIDLFDDQDTMPASSISITDAEGNSVAATVEVDSTGATSTGNTITLNFERQSSSILVPVRVNGKEVYFLFDTGASYTTLSPKFARSINVLPKKDYPVGMSQTAGGPRPMQFGLIDRLDLGSRRHTAVTYAICEQCPSGVYKGRPIVGLLGLNVVGRYRYSIDDGAGKIEMTPHSDFANRKRDVFPWLKVAFNASPESFEEWRAEAIVSSLAPRPIRDLQVHFTCSNGAAHALGSKNLSAKGKTTFAKTFSGQECPGMDFDVISARW